MEDKTWLDIDLCLFDGGAADGGDGAGGITGEGTTGIGPAAAGQGKAAGDRKGGAPVAGGQEGRTDAQRKQERRKHYVGIIHPDVSYDLMSDPKWVNVKTYADPEGIYEGEIGRIEGVRFVETSEAKVFTGAGAGDRDVYSTLILGGDAYGVTEITGGGLQHIIKQLGSAGTSDPLDQRATAGWKATKAAERLVEAYMVRVETTSTFTA